MKRNIIPVILASLIMAGCGESQVSDTAEVVETASIAEAGSESTDPVETTAAETTIFTTAMTEATTLEETTAITTIPEPTEEDEGGVYDVERGFFVTRVSYPISHFKKWDEDFDAEKRVDEVNNGGADEVEGLLSAETDGETITYVWKTSSFNKMKKEVYEQVVGMNNDIVNDESNSIIGIENDDDFSNIYVYVSSQDEYNANFDYAKIFGIAVSPFAGRELGFFSQETTVHVIDSQTGTEFYTDNFPESNG